MAAFGLGNILFGKGFLLCGIGSKGKINMFVIKGP